MFSVTQIFHVQHIGVHVFCPRCISIFFVEFQAYFGQDYARTAWIHSIVDCATMLCGEYYPFKCNVAAFASAPSGFSMLTSWWSQRGKSDTVGSLGYGISKLLPSTWLCKEGSVFILKRRGRSLFYEMI